MAFDLRMWLEGWGEGHWHYPASWTVGAEPWYEQYYADGRLLYPYQHYWQWVREQIGPDTVEKAEWEGSDATK